ncbi:DUF2637 domain-containing protein [Leucobacter ruminantium]|uniref:DUF2637 domain-containing protein n=1 Tax=Leucobacter ruminantium TaxID=1289170 RepID=A0A939LTE2_9MICO|nr:DUF2637 domain-containing protein [Leucobacter ruminantium]MBO1804475.1 DUF2637 domain-containing protein [Leucobacter ruminantium]
MSSGTVWAGRAPSWWAAQVAVTGTVIIAVGAFWLSFVALTDLARMAGIGGERAWIWAVIVDGVIVISTVAVFSLDGHGWRIVAYPWTLLALSAGVSVVANIVHSVLQAPPEVPAVLAGAIAAVPPLTLLAATHLTVLLIRHAGRGTPTEPFLVETPAHPEPDAPPAQAEREKATDPAPAVPVSAESHPADDSRTPTTAAPRSTGEGQAGRSVSRPTPGRTRAPRTGGSGVGRSVDPALRVRALELAAAGRTGGEIAAEIGVHRSTVNRWISQHATPSTTPEDGGPAPLPVSPELESGEAASRPSM